MRNARVLVIGFVLLALAVASGCAKRQLTGSETSRLDAIAAKIAEAERIGAPDCVPPRELARAKVALEHAQHELLEHFETAGPAVKEAEAAADALLARTQACLDAKKPAPAQPPAPVPEPAPMTSAPAEPPAAPEEAVFENIHFDFDKFFIREDAKPKLAKVAAHMRTNNDAKILIEGHCDERGTAEYNMALGERRANSAKKYLTALGIDAKRLSTVSYGKERPLDPEHNEGAWAKNRRAVFVLKP
jgi:peptidoglycan-associated lipoprotein